LIDVADVAVVARYGWVRLTTNRRFHDRVHVATGRAVWPAGRAAWATVGVTAYGVPGRARPAPLCPPTDFTGGDRCGRSGWLARLGLSWVRFARTSRCRPNSWLRGEWPPGEHGRRSTRQVGVGQRPTIRRMIPTVVLSRAFALRSRMRRPTFGCGERGSGRGRTRRRRRRSGMHRFLTKGSSTDLTFVRR
jgi:hypothetical protein